VWLQFIIKILGARRGRALVFVSSFISKHKGSVAGSPATTFLCRRCGKEHPGPPFSWGVEAPDEWTALTASQRRSKGELSSDQCIINPDRYFIRGSLELPVIDGAGQFVWDVWVSLSESNFKRASERWHDPDRIKEPPYFGWLCNSLPGYPETLNLKTSVHTRAVRVRPFIELEPTDHPLAVEQREGITMARVIEIAGIAMHHNAALPPEKLAGIRQILKRILS
jgi:hypothetical protein